MTKNIVAIILAAGKSKRIGKNYKQFLKIKSKSVLFFSLEKFIKCKFLGKIIIVVPKEKMYFAQSLIKEAFKDQRIVLVVGGRTRQQSSYNALKYLSKNNIKPNLVIFHDAARPVITVEMIKTLVREASKWGAAVIARKAIDLVLIAEKGFISATLKKDVYYGYTPQCFNFNLIREGHLKSDRERFVGSADNIELLQRLDEKIRIKIIDNFYQPPKLTFKQDIKMIKGFLGQHKTH